MDTLFVSFNIPISQRKISQFRGAMSDWVMKYKSTLLTEEEMALFHNHKHNNGYYYRYPLIQYRCVRGKAGMLVLKEAIPVVQRVLMDTQPTFVMRGKKRELEWTNMNKRRYRLEMTKDKKMLTYRLQNWVALNNDRMKEWEEMRGMTQRTNMMKEVLAGHIIAFAIGMDWHIPERFEVEILELEGWQKIPYHKVHLNGFDVTFRVPLYLPSGVGLGKAASHGFGILRNK